MRFNDPNRAFVKRLFVFDRLRLLGVNLLFMMPVQQRLRNSPLVSYVALFVMAILVNRLFPLVGAAIWAGCFVASLFALILLSYLIKSGIRKPRWLSIGYYLALFFFCLSYVSFSQQQQQYVVSSSKGEYSGMVSEVLSSAPNRMKLMVRMDEFRKGDSTWSFNETVLISCSDSTAIGLIASGSRLTLKTKLYEIRSGGNPGQFDFQRYMELKGIRYQGFVERGVVVVKQNRVPLRVKALQIRDRLMSLYRKGPFSRDELGVLSALTIGDRNLLSTEMKTNFSVSGAMHVLSVSGLHVGIICIMLGRMLSLLKWSKRGAIVKSALIILSLWGYAFISGLSPSVLRSATMFSFIEFGKATKNKGNFFNTLAASAFILLLISPAMLFDIGFQLSYMAVASIVFFQPRFASLFKPQNRVLNWIWEMLTVSLAAQLGTTPISLFYFHQFPTYFWLTNMVVVPLAAWILYLAVVYFAVSFIPLISVVVGFILKWLVFSLIWVVNFIETLPGSVVEGIWISGWVTFVLYMVLFFLTAAFLARSALYLKMTIIAIIVLLIGSGATYFKSVSQKKVIVYNLSQTPLFSYIEGKNHFYYSFSPEPSPYELNILKNVSGKYHARKPLPGNGVRDSNVPVCFHQPFLVIGNIIIEFSTSNPFSEAKGPGEIVINQSRREAWLNGEMINNKHGIYSRQKVKNQINFGYLHDLKKEGAILIDLR